MVCVSEIFFLTSAGLTLRLVALLRRRLDDAKIELDRQQVAFTAFSVEQADKVPGWKAVVDDFEADGTRKNPYEVEVKGKPFGIAFNPQLM